MNQLLTIQQPLILAMHFCLYIDSEAYKITCTYLTDLLP